MNRPWERMMLDELPDGRADDTGGRSYDDEELCWTAVLARDRRADGAFVFGVRTTGIYCRPSCPARAPNRQNVTFHAGPAEARQLGFRACKRCRPDVPASEVLDVQAVTAAARLIDAAIEAEEPAPQLQQLANVAGFSVFHFHRMFKRVLGLTPKAYATALRSRRLRSELRESSSITDAIYGAGYSSPSRFYETANARLGMTPKSHRAGGAGAMIRHAITGTTLGPLLVAATQTGICTIEFGDNEDALLQRLAERFPLAERMTADAAFERLVATVVSLVEEPGIGRDLPLDVRGTAFQERVWAALRCIPAGTTASYAEIATLIGRPRAVRGVAQACAANPAAVVIPCHRVVRSDGALSGYRWGVERKAALLARERGR